MEPITAIPWLDTYNSTFEDDILGLTDPLHNDPSPLFGLLPSQNTDDNRATELPIPNGAAYFGPTILDIENALSIAPRSKDSSFNAHISHSAMGFSILERGSLNKVEHKYSLKMKSCGGNLVADDGYKWRKYGQKSIKNSPNPRSYYRCSNPRCSAKKQVERSIEDPDTFIITYEGLHLHFTYPFFLMGQTPQAQTPTKKPKTTDPDPEAQFYEAQKSPILLAPGPPQLDPKEATGPQGLLEDMVPWMIRNPSTNQNALSTSSSCSSYRSLSTSPPSPSTCPTYMASYF